MQHTQKGKAKRRWGEGEDPLMIKKGKNEILSQWSWRILALSPTHLLLEVSHRPRPTLEQLVVALVNIK
jgi:hypothetical protein